MSDEDKSPMGILFLVVLVDMIGFTIVIPFLTYFIQDLATADGFTDVAVSYTHLTLPTICSV